MKGFGGGMQQLMRQANQMQNKMKKLQEELATREFEGSAGGGGVKITVSGSQQLCKVVIDPELLKGDETEMLQDLILLAANEALKTAKETSDKEMAKITGGFSPAGLF